MPIKRYDSIDGLRAISCILIIAMHIQANTDYKLGGYIWDKIIPSWTWLVPLFIMISGFSMCAGYLDKFIKGGYDLEAFYTKRYKKILPFFSFLILISLVMEHSLQAIYEGSFELTLLFGMLPNNDMSILGVCWTLGVIFLFYLVFPAFSVLMRNKKRAWISLLISLWIVFVLTHHFFGPAYVTESFTGRHNFLYCLPLFVAGGILYLYRESIQTICKKYRWLVLAVLIAITVVWYLIPCAEAGMKFYVKTLILFSLCLFYAIGVDSKILQSKPMKYISSISLEMYLAQMVIFRGIEKMHLLYVTGNPGVDFVIACVLVVGGLIVFIEVFKYGRKTLEKMLSKTKTEGNA